MTKRVRQQLNRMYVQKKLLALRVRRAYQSNQQTNPGWLRYDAWELWSAYHDLSNKLQMLWRAVKKRS